MRVPQRSKMLIPGSPAKPRSNVMIVDMPCRCMAAPWTHRGIGSRPGVSVDHEVVSWQSPLRHRLCQPHRPAEARRNRPTGDFGRRSESPGLQG